MARSILVVAVEVEVEAATIEPKSLKGKRPKVDPASYRAGNKHKGKCGAGLVYLVQHWPR